MELKNMNGFCELNENTMMEIDGGMATGTFCGGYSTNLSGKDFCQTASYFCTTMAIATAPVGGAPIWGMAAATFSYLGR